MEKIILALACLLSTLYARNIESVIEPRANNFAIIGGQAAREGQFPWQISLRHKGYNKNNGHVCGGSIISSEWILTAAHCFNYSRHVDLNPNHYLIVAGSIFLSSGGATHQISEIITHSDYNKFHFINDIAVLKLKEEIRFTNNIQPIQLETKNVGEVACTISGWGSYSHYLGPSYDNLQYLEIQTAPIEKCQIIPEKICVFSEFGKYGVCSGDSGGALVANGRQIGITSYGDPLDCALGSPDVYTRVSSFIDWIQEKTKIKIY